MSDKGGMVKPLGSDAIATALEGSPLDPNKPETLQRLEEVALGFVTSQPPESNLFHLNLRFIVSNAEILLEAIYAKQATGR